MKPNVITADVARLERALVLVAYLVVRDGEIARSLYDRLARELATSQEKTRWVWN